MISGLRGLVQLLVQLPAHESLSCLAACFALSCFSVAQLAWCGGRALETEFPGSLDVLAIFACPHSHYYQACAWELLDAGAPSWQLDHTPLHCLAAGRACKLTHCCHAQAQDL